MECNAVAYLFISSVAAGAVLALYVIWLALERREREARRHLSEISIELHRIAD